MADPRIKVKVGADTDELDRGLKRASSNVRAFASSAKGKLGGALKVAGVAAVAAGAGLLSFGKAQADIIDKNAKLARSLGLTHNEFASMAMVAGEAGVATGQLSQMLGIMQRNIIELEKGTKTQADAFARLGLSVSDLEGQSPAQQFETIATALNGIEDPATRTATAMDVLGKSGRGAINMLDGYAEKVAEATAFQEKFGLAVSDVDAASIEAANDALGRVFEVIKGVGRMIASYMAPLIKYMADSFLNSATTADTFRDVGERAMAIVGGAIDLVRRGILGIQIAFTTVKAAVLSFTATTIRALMPVINAMDYISGTFGGGTEFGANLEATANSYERFATSAERAAGAQREAWSSFESTADAIARIRAEVLAAQESGALDGPDGGGEVTAPTTSIPSIGGGDDVRAAMLDRFTALQEGLMTEREALDAWRDEGLQALREYNASKEAIEGESLETRRRLEESYAKQVQEIEARKNSQMQSSQQAFVSASLGALNNLFKGSKAVRVAMAIADTFAGATRALAEHPAPLSYGIAAAVVANGLANVKSIMSAKPGSSATGGGAAATAASSAAAETPTQTFAFTIQNDPMGFGENFARQMIEQLNEAQRNGGQVRGVLA